jgi:hypothetical protein
VRVELGDHAFERAFQERLSVDWINVLVLDPSEDAPELQQQGIGVFTLGRGLGVPPDVNRQGGSQGRDECQKAP